MIDGPLLLQGLVLSSQDFSIQTCNLVLSDSINMVSPSLTCMVSPSLTWHELLKKREARYSQEASVNSDQYNNSKSNNFNYVQSFHDT